MTQDFSGQNLRGQSFKGQDLAGANFSHAFIQGADFTGANLRDANFCQVTAGLQKRWTWTLVVLSWLVAGFSGFYSGSMGVTVSLLIYASPKIPRYLAFRVAGWLGLIILVILLILLLWRGIFRTEIVIIALATACIAFGVISVLLQLSIVFVFSLVIALLIALAGKRVFIIFVAIAVAFLNITISIAIANLFRTGAFEGTGVFERSIRGLYSELSGSEISISISLAVCLLLCGVFIGWRAMCGDEKHALIRDIAITFITFRGTKFCSANLTNVDFSAANLKSTDFRQAILVGTHFHNVSKLDLVRPSDSYLQTKQLRQLIVSGDVKDKNFDRQDLRGINLQGCHLAGASFIGTNLSQANLQEADLSQATLVQAQVDGTDFTGATLTGAYIQDWNITTTTKFDDVKCKYVYMRKPTADNPEPHRKPDNRQEEFADGEFGDFIKPIFDTLDLYHSQDVDPRAIAISYKQLAENNPDAEIEFVAMEKRGKDGILLRAKTSPQADKSALNAEYFLDYEKYKGLSLQEMALQLAHRDGQIQQLEKFETMVRTVLESPRTQTNTTIEKVDTMNQNPGSFSVGDNMSGNINNVQGDNNRTIQGNDNQAILGDHNQVDQSTAPASTHSQTEILNLLTQLIASIKGSEIPPDTKTEILEDLTAVQTATDKPEPNKPRALDRLNSAATTIEKTSKTLEASQKIWTTAKPFISPIAKWLGAAAGSSLLGL